MGTVGGGAKKKTNFGKKRGKPEKQEVIDISLMNLQIFIFDMLFDCD